MRIFQNSDSFPRICGRVIDSLLSVHLRHYSCMTLAYGLSSTENKISKALFFFFLNSNFFPKDVCDSTNRTWRAFVMRKTGFVCIGI